MKREYIYYWYHHMMPIEERKKIEQALDNKNYFDFINLYKKYTIESIKLGKYYEEFQAWCPMVYLPDYISVWENNELIDHISILDKKNFDAITAHENECG